MAMTPAEFARSFDDDVRSTLTTAAQHVPSLRRRLRECGLTAQDLTDVTVLERLPVLGKDALVELQRSEPPFGGLLAPGARVRRIYQSPGPLYEPELWDEDLAGWHVGLRAAGIGAGDVVLNAFGYHLSPAGMLFDAAALQLGAAVVPGGVGSKELQARACRAAGVSGYLGLPSYLKALLQQRDGRSVPDEPAADGATPARASLGIRRAFVSGEPLSGELRAWLDLRVPVVRQGYGTAEAGLLGYECSRREGLHVPPDRLVQVCDLSTGRPLWDGQEGEVVATVFSPNYGLVRFGTGDVSSYLTEPCGCGDPAPRICGWLGRIGDAVKVRGMFLHPRQIDAVMAGVPEVRQYRFTVEHDDHYDRLRCEIAVANGGSAQAVRSAVHEAVRDGLRFDVDVEFVERISDGSAVLIDQRRWR